MLVMADAVNLQNIHNQENVTHLSRLKERENTVTSLCVLLLRIFLLKLGSFVAHKKLIGKSEWQLTFLKTENVQHQKQSYNLHSIYMAELGNLTQHLDCA